MSHTATVKYNKRITTAGDRLLAVVLRLAHHIPRISKGDEQEVHDRIQPESSQNKPLNWVGEGTTTKSTSTLPLDRYGKRIACTDQNDQHHVPGRPKAQSSLFPRCDKLHAQPTMQRVQPRWPSCRSTANAPLQIKSCCLPRVLSPLRYHILV